MLFLLLLLLPIATSAVPLESVPNEVEGWLQICCIDNDKNGDGGISFREYVPFVQNLMQFTRKEMETMFLSADEDRNSDLDGSECFIIRKILREKMRAKVQQFKQTYDVNHDGRLTQDEIRHLAKTEYGLSQEQSDDVYFQLSTSKAGSMDDIQMAQLLVNLREVSLQNAHRAIRAWDSNNNTVVSYEEVRKGLKEIPAKVLKQAFKKVDLNKDYHLSHYEYLEMQQLLNATDTRSEIIRSKRYSDLSKEKSVAKWRKYEAVRTKREDTQTAPPSIEVAELPSQLQSKVSLKNPNNMSGGLKGTPIDELPIIPFDDPDFQ